jgi:hypothetical protein
MTDNIEDVMAAIKVEQVLVSILNTVGEVRVNTDKFFEARKDNYELVMSYDDEGPAFTFSVRDKNDENAN